MVNKQAYTNHPSRGKSHVHAVAADAEWQEVSEFAVASGLWLYIGAQRRHYNS
ncbi:MAG: hypothetical protein ACLPRE_14390 [Limisphaerales bacterium]